MSDKDAAECYLASVAQQPPPSPEQQLSWARSIDRAQCGINRALTAAPTALQQLLLLCRMPKQEQRVLARYVHPQVLSCADSAVLLDTQLSLLQSALRGHAAASVASALQPLRLRSEFLLRLCTALQSHGARSEELQRCVGQIRRRLRRIEHATAHLVQANQRLIVALARQYRNSPLAFMDLVQEGNLGLLRAIERFDPHYGTRVSTYAMWWVRRAMVYAIARQGRDVRPSVAQYWSARQVLRAHDELECRHGRRATQQETAQHMGITLDAVREGLTTLLPVVRLDMPLGRDEDLPRIDRLASAQLADPQQAVCDRDLRRLVAEWLDKLPARQATILRLRFGIGIRDDCTLEQIARQQGVTRERIRQIEAQALAMLRKLGMAALLRDTL